MAAKFVVQYPLSLAQSKVSKEQQLTFPQCLVHSSSQEFFSSRGKEDRIWRMGRHIWCLGTGDKGSPSSRSRELCPPEA